MRLSPSLRIHPRLQMSHQTSPKISIRPETLHDIPQIHSVITSAFAAKSHLNHKEADIVDFLRAAGALSHSLVATKSSTLIGHISLSPILIADQPQNHGWYGLGPLSVQPAHQGRGIGRALVKAALKALEDSGAAGCVVAGSPKFYQQFGFECDPSMTFEGAPAKYFQRVVLKGPVVRGKVRYHEAFDVV